MTSGAKSPGKTLDMHASAKQTKNNLGTFTALSVEFVAMPGFAQMVRETIPTDLEEAFRDVDGYAGCMILTSDQEARLVTVVTLWSGAERGKRCHENAKWVKALLAPCVDRWLRTQTLVTSLRGSAAVCGFLGPLKSAREERG
jgi:hypothetical protein